MDTKQVQTGQGYSLWVVGDLYTIKASGEDTGGAFALIEARVPPGGGPPPHIHHREDEAFYVLEGQLEFSADGRTFLATQGSWITLAKGSLHHFKNIGATAAKLLILVTPSGLEKFFMRVGRAVNSPDELPSPPTAEEIARLIEVAPEFGVEIKMT